MGDSLKYYLKYGWVKIRCTLAYWLAPKKNTQGLALHCMFQNEASFLAEWLDYHFSLGFDHIFLTNDQSTDNYKAILKPYLNKGLVSLENARADLDFYSREEWHKNDILKRAEKKFKWVGFLDSDEFIYCRYAKIETFLNEHTNEAGLVLSSFFYGTSGVEELAPGELITEKLTQRFPDDYHEHRTVKSIVQTGMGLRFFNKNPHYPQYSPLARLHWCDGSRFKPAERKIIREPLSINHYWYRTEKFYRQVKRPRRVFFEGGERKPHIEEWHRKNANAIKDDRLAAKSDNIREFRKAMRF